MKNERPDATPKLTDDRAGRIHMKSLGLEDAYLLADCCAQDLRFAQSIGVEDPSCLYSVCKRIVQLRRAELAYILIDRSSDSVVALATCCIDCEPRLYNLSVNQAFKSLGYAEEAIRYLKSIGAPPPSKATKTPRYSYTSTQSNTSKLASQTLRP